MTSVDGLVARAVAKREVGTVTNQESQDVHLAARCSGVARRPAGDVDRVAIDAAGERSLDPGDVAASCVGPDVTGDFAVQVSGFHRFHSPSTTDSQHALSFSALSRCRVAWQLKQIGPKMSPFRPISTFFSGLPRCGRRAQPL